MEYKHPSAEMLEKLRAVAPGRVYTGADVSEDYDHDEMEFFGHYKPDAVVRAETTEEVSAVCRLCYENDVPIVPRGAGTGLSAGCVPIAGGVIIDTSKMNKILGFDMGSLVVRVQCGVLVQDVQEACSQRGMMYPPDPGEKLATVGGNVATNAGGMRACKYGTTRDWVAAMTVVLPDGEIMHFGAEVSKNCSGYSLLNLMIGSEGTLGIVTELSLKFIPQPEATISLLGCFADLASCIANVSRLKGSNFDPQALEFMTRSNVDSIHKYLGKTVYPGECDGQRVEAYLLVTFDGHSEEELYPILESAAELLVENGALDVQIYDTPDAYRNAWLVRGSTLEALLDEFELQDETDIVVPIPKIAEFVEYGDSIQEEVGLVIRSTGHAGDGNVHMNACAHDMDLDEFRRRIDKYFELMYAKAKELNGLISGEHGIGAAKVKYLQQSLGIGQMRLMARIKRAFDPKMLLNPGKVCYELGEEDAYGITPAAPEVAGSAIVEGVSAADHMMENLSGSDVLVADGKTVASSATDVMAVNAIGAGGKATDISVTGSTATSTLATDVSEKSVAVADVLVTGAVATDTLATDASATGATKINNMSTENMSAANRTVTAQSAADAVATNDTVGDAAGTKSESEAESAKPAVEESAASELPTRKDLNILICMKQVPDDEVKVSLGADGKPDTGKIATIVNAFDTYALEMALRCREANGGKITVMTIGEEATVRPGVVQMIAIGANNGYIFAPATENYDEYSLAVSLAEAVKKCEEEEGAPFDLILCGKESTDEISSQTGARLSEELGVGFTSSVIGFEPVDGGKIRVQKEVEDGSSYYEMPYQSICTIAKPDYDPRYPSIKGKMAARKAKIPYFTDALSPVEPAVSCIAYEEPPKREAGIKIEEDEAAAAVARAMEILKNDKVL